MTSSSKQIFKKSELPLLKEQNDKKLLGFVSVDHIAGLYGIRNLYTFVHLTFQEYLAAVHLSSLEKEEQMKMMTKYGKEKHMQVVWKFYCGIVNFQVREDQFKSILGFHDNSLFHCQCAFESQQPNLCTTISKNLSFKDQILNPSDCTVISYVLSNCGGGIRQIFLSGCSLGDNIKHLEDGLKLCINLSVLDLSSNNIGGSVACALGCLKKCMNLENLDLSLNHIGDGGAHILACNLLCHDSLKELHIRRNGIGEDGASVLAGSLKQFKNLKVLDLSDNCIGNGGLKCLAENVSLEKVCFNRVFHANHIMHNDVSLSKYTVCALADNLKQCHRLTTLVLSGVGIDNVHALTIASGLKHCHSLETLYLSYNLFGCVGAKAFAQALTHCSNLTTLDLQGNQICDVGAVALAGWFKSLKDLHLLDLSKNKIGDNGAKALAEGLEHCIKLRKLDISSNRIGYEAAKGLEKHLLMKNSELKISL